MAHVNGHPRLIRLEHAKLEYTDYGCLTTFHDGSSIASIPHYRDFHYHVISHRTGYGDDLLRYCQEHDFAHLFVAEKLCGAVSPILWALAHGKSRESPMEELSVQAFQRWLRANEEPIVGGVNWHELKAQALALLG